MSEGADRVTSIGSQVRVRRRQQGVTLQELAERADLSQSFLSKVERGMAQLSIGALNRVAQALGTSALGLFGGMNPDRRVEVVRADERRKMPSSDDGSGLVHALTGRPGQLRVVELAGGPSSMPEEFFWHRNDALSLVLEGVFEFEVDGDLYELHPGDALSATGGVAHRYRVLSPPGRLIVVIVSEDVEVIVAPPPHQFQV